MPEKIRPPVGGNAVRNPEPAVGAVQHPVPIGRQTGVEELEIDLAIRRIGGSAHVGCLVMEIRICRGPVVDLILAR
jgi:hypothetical protein